MHAHIWRVVFFHVNFLSNFLFVSIAKRRHINSIRSCFPCTSLAGTFNSPGRQNYWKAFLCPNFVKQFLCYSLEASSSSQQSWIKWQKQGKYLFAESSPQERNGDCTIGSDWLYASKEKFFVKQQTIDFAKLLLHWPKMSRVFFFENSAPNVF